MMRVRTRNSEYEFKFGSEKPDYFMHGTVSKNGQPWSECHMLSFIELDSIMVMMLGPTADSGIRTTTAVTGIDYIA